ncbi:hypothetical protein TanjilG_07210 [Lupinus angustifolius]|uniref:Late embryogenesis abundant protein LEA-2 subgroup domain-containing protein n=1 Tax=Lupinus angustifolius TaxID=3871 RepID=A0A1J7GZM2_LUPAN|nr:PREDICTED: uncharacterized protein LOC109354083 [Lupinus angustifolius]OIW05934.1 hypothetical protein TanjilG_07210 [Lupinus angustifolius]
MGIQNSIGHYLEPQTVTTKQRLKICFAVSALFFIIVATVIVTLTFTTFKIKDPDVSLRPVGLENFQFFTPNSTIEPLSMLITVVNPNYGRFKSINSIGYLNYRHNVIAKVPFEKIVIPAHSKINVSTTAGIVTKKLMSDPKFWTDIEVGALNLTANVILPGKVSMIKIFKLKATVTISCGIYLNLSAVDADSSCITKIKL